MERYLNLSAWWSNIVEGVIRLGMMVGYIWGVGKMPDIARVFAYHGAEHKTINAFEAGAELTPEIVAQYSLDISLLVLHFCSPWCVFVLLSGIWSLTYGMALD